ncbi:MAG: hypothetical protein KGS48_15510, partial [Bacteroidetes bacterium]|nr:hypothetical protein [Bacteroidota bacterium]
MKIKNFLLICLAISAFLPLHAQWSVVKETNRTMSFGSRPCFRMEFATASPALLEDNWKGYVKSNFNGKLKTDRKTGELFATDLKSNLVGDDPFGIYSTIERTATGSILTVWIDMGSYFLNRGDNRSSTEAVGRSLSTFYYDTRRAEINKQIKDQ